MDLLAVALIFVALLAGIALGWFFRSRADGGRDEADFKAAIKELADAQIENSALKATLAANTENFDKQLAALNEAREAMLAQFRATGGEVLAKAQEQFLETAKERFGHTEKASEEKLKALLEPVHSRLKSYEDQVTGLEKQRVDAFGQLAGLIQSMKEGQQAVRDEAEALLAAQGNRSVVLISGAGWHPGVIGIVASRIKERAQRPAIIVAVDEGIGKGSGRSVTGVDLGAAVMAAKDAGLLVAGGGHAMAAGLTVDAERLDALADFLDERLAADVAAASEARALLVDAVVGPGGVTPELVEALEAGGPYGAGWPSPRVAAGPVRLLKTGIVGDGHVRGIAAGEDGKSFKWIAFRSASTDLGQALLGSPGDRRWWLAGTIKRDEWNGGNAAEMHVEDAALA